jgi:hypothetical protein
MSEEPIKLTVAGKSKIRSWKDLLHAALELEKDYDNHGYGATRSSGRKYCADVKVHSYGDPAAAISKLGLIDHDVQLMLEHAFDDETSSALFQEWIDDSSAYIKDWFKGVAHSTPEYYDKMIEKALTGAPTSHPHLEEMSSVKAKVAEIRKWQAEDTLFREAFKAADDGDSIVWEGRSGGYVTWDPCSDVGRIAGEVADVARDAIDGGEPAQAFQDALTDFRYAERVHLLNLALIDYLEAWADRMYFQDELDRMVRDRFEELGGVEKSKSLMERYGDLEVTVKDSLAAGNCESGTMQWVERNLAGRVSATIRELLQIDDMQLFVRRLCRFVIRKHTYGH